jgi:hypothetical protein
MQTSTVERERAFGTSARTGTGTGILVYRPKLDMSNLHGPETTDKRRFGLRICLGTRGLYCIRIAGRAEAVHSSHQQSTIDRLWSVGRKKHQ